MRDRLARVDVLGRHDQHLGHLRHDGVPDHGVHRRLRTGGILKLGLQRARRRADGCLCHGGGGGGGGGGADMVEFGVRQVGGLHPLLLLSRVREPDQQLGVIDIVHRGRDRVVEHGQQLLDLDGAEPLRGQVAGDGGVFRHVAGVDDHADVDGARGHALTGAGAGEGVLEGAGGRVVRLPAVADDADERGEEDEEVKFRGESGGYVEASLDLGTEGGVVVLVGEFVDGVVLKG